METLQIDVLVVGTDAKLDAFFKAVRAVRGAEKDFQRECLVVSSYPVFYGGDTPALFGHVVTVNLNFPYAWVIFPGLALAAGLTLWKQANTMEKL
jgi:hypothetical protein